MYDYIFIHPSILTSIRQPMTHTHIFTIIMYTCQPITWSLYLHPSFHPYPSTTQLPTHYTSSSLLKSSHSSANETPTHYIFMSLLSFISQSLIHSLHTSCILSSPHPSANHQPHSHHPPLHPHHQPVIHSLTASLSILPFSHPSANNSH